MLRGDNYAIRFLYTERFSLQGEAEEGISEVKVGSLVEIPMGEKSLRFNGVQHVIAPLAFSDGKLMVMKAEQVRFCEALMKCGGDIQKACETVGMGEDQAIKFLKSRRFRKFMHDRMKEVAIRSGVTQDWWFSEGWKIYSGEKDVDKMSLEAWKELGARVAPRHPSNSGEAMGQRPHITINIGEMEKARARQEALEAEVIEG